MSQTMTQHRPRRRETEIVTREISDEVLIYDLKTHKAHCLNATATQVWKRCDGKTSIPQIAKILEHELKASVNDDVVWLAIDQLEKLHLLDRPNTLRVQPGMSRRTMMRNMGLATAVALPLVTSLIAPTPALAATCAPVGTACPGPIACCGFCNTPAGVCA